MSINFEDKAEQYYPTYRSVHRDILLLEYEEANKIANSQTKVYGQMASALIAGLTILIPLFFESDQEKSHFIFKAIQENAVLFSAIISIFGFLLLRYFVDLQKQITINARKVVTLRILLGLDYGTIHLTLPNWRVEGATNPFAIKYFVGWLRFRSSPFWVLTIGVNSIWWLSIKDKVLIYSYGSLVIHWYWVNIFITILYLYIFRTNLNDRHETNWLNITKIFSRNILAIKLVPNFEYILYRTKLSYIELERLQLDYESMKGVLISIEDKSFYSNSGVSYRSLFRSVVSRFKYIRRKSGFIESGGSTITMQLCRTLFIRPSKYKFRRKIIEILLAYWLNSQFSKDEILRLYISCVRYERKVIGLSQAIKYFFETPIKGKKLTLEESFFLCERLSNITSTIKLERIKYLAKNVSGIDIVSLLRLYELQVLSKKLKYAS